MQKNMNMLVSNFIVLMSIMIIIEQENGPLTKNFCFDSFSNFLIFMTALVMFISINKIWDKNNTVFITMMMMASTIIFYFSFLTNNIFIFYIFFEMSVCPLLFFVAAWGYSLERVKASIYMFIFTFALSFPFLMVMLYNMKSMKMSMMMYFMDYNNYSNFEFFFVQLLFLVKMPLWGMHIWLTKAHVEASTEGSMILAGVVLKMAGMGMIKFSCIYSNTMMEKMMLMISIISVMGALFLSIMVVRISDMKLIIAISSVIHMSFMYCCYTMFSSLALSNLMLIMVAHGIVSPLMFFLMGEYYDVYYSRSMHLMKGIISITTYIAIIWFLMCMFNMGMPLTLNFFAELMFFFNMASYSKTIVMFASLLIFLNGIINTYLFVTSQTGSKKISKEIKMSMKKFYMMYTSLLMSMVIFFT